MRAISLWQPWASLLVLGTKTMETRNWSTNYRGPLLIHAAKRMVKSELIKLGSMPEFQAAFHPLTNAAGPPIMPYALFGLPFGAIVGQVDLVDCISTNKIDRWITQTDHPIPGTTVWDGKTWREEDLGNFAPNRYAWICKNPIKFEVPIPFKGSQGFFGVPDELLEEFECFQCGDNVNKCHGIAGGCLP